MGTTHRGSPSGPLDLQKTTVDIDFGTLSPATVKRVTAALVGLRTTDLVVVEPNANFVGVDIGLVGARVSAAGVIEVSLINPTGGSITAGSQTLRVEIQRFTS